jgi:hypothetical protein
LPLSYRSALIETTLETSRDSLAIRHTAAADGCGEGLIVAASWPQALDIKTTEMAKACMERLFDERSWSGRADAAKHYRP